MSPMNNRLLVPQKLPLLLDYAGGAAAAYSLRSLSNSYVGPVVTVRRSTDNAEQGFTSTEVSDGTLAAWCGGGDGFVKTWHDQSHNGRDATQTTTAAQPKIVSSGVVVTEGGKAALQFDGANDFLTTSAVATAPNASAFMVAKAGEWMNPAGYRGIASHAYSTSLTLGIGFAALAGASSQDWLAGDILSFGSGYGAASTPRAIGPVASGSDIRCVTTILGSTAAEVRINGALASTRVSSSGAIAATTGAILIGAGRVNAEFWLGTISEMMYYQSNQLALRDRITADQMWYY